MRARRLLWLFPRAWRERYGDELLAVAGDERLGPRQVIDVVAGAIDAWTSPEVRRVVGAARARSARGDDFMLRKMMTSCGHAELNLSRREAWIAAAAMIGGTLLFSALGILAKRNGFPGAGEAVLAMAFPGALLLAMPFTYLKGKPWRVQVVLVGVPLLLLVAAGFLAQAT